MVNSATSRVPFSAAKTATTLKFWDKKAQAYGLLVLAFCVASYPRLLSIIRRSRREIDDGLNPSF